MSAPSRFQKPVPAMPGPTNQDRLSAYLVEADTAARAAEQRWGVGRLPMLVSPETLLKFKAANDLLTATISSGNDAEMVRVGPMMARAWARMELEATERGHLPLSPSVWEASMADGRVLAIVRTQAEAHSVAADRRGVVCYTVDELARLMPQFEMLNAIKTEFPGAAVIAGPRKSESFASDWVTSDDFLALAHGEAA